MKNKVFTTILLALIMIFGVQLAAQAVVVSTDKTVQSGSGTVTISVTATQELGAYNLKLTDTAGLTLVSATGGAVGVVSSDNKTISGASDTGVTSLGTFTFNVPTVDADTKYNVKFSITGMETPDFDPVANETNTAVITVEALEEDDDSDLGNSDSGASTTPGESTTNPDPKPTVLEFTSVNETVYANGTVNVRESYSADSRKLGQLKAGDSVTRIGISKTADKDNNGWSKINFNGTTAYVISSKLTTTKPEENETADEPTEEPVDEPEEDEPTVTTNEIDNDETEAEAKTGLKSLVIEGQTLTPSFNSKVYEYRVILKQDISELKISAVPAVEGATITIAGNENIQEGENLITLMVYNEEDAVEATYQITVNKTTVDLSITDKLLQAGNSEATRNLIMFFALILVAIIGLIVVIILKRRNQNEEENYEENIEQSTENEQIVENTPEEIEIKEIQNEDSQEETPRPRTEKRKGKHF